MTTIQPRRATLSVDVGGVAPVTHGMALDGAFYSLEAQAGRPAAIVLVGALPIGSARAAFAELERRAAEFATRQADVVALIDMQGPDAIEFAIDPAPTPRKIYCEPDLFSRWGFTCDRPTLVIIDRAARVVAVFDLSAPSAAVDAAVASLADLPFELPRDDLLPAPVLAIPQIFDRELRQQLIAHFEASAHRFGGMAAVGANGNAIHKIDETKKHRSDLVLGARDPFLGRALEAIITRCLPEIKKVFHVDACHTDRLLIARYDETGGYFRRHRDNAAPSVAFRQFALSVNLNADYEGGHLLFPEYNARRYKPGAGAGVVFSCSLLHEAAPVTRGRRYVLLTFLHDAAAQARWLEGSARHS
jgi:predicted 2-oxoglutarate/Fe(II)-dependent dioxygenase YbiX